MTIAVKILLFASAREAVGAAQDAITLPAPASVQTLQDALRARGGAWRRLLDGGQPLKFAVNHQFADSAAALQDGDEVAIFPPVTGG